MKRIVITIGLFVVAILAACQPAAQPEGQPATDLPRVIAVESFLADIAQQVAGDRLQVESLMPAGADPHTYEPIPADMVRISEAQVIIINGAGFEAWIEPLLAGVDGERLVIEASAGLTSREAEENHDEGEEAGEEEHADEEEHNHLVDPHFWLDPLLVVRYVENIRDGLSSVDPEGAALYAQNAETYIASLKALDAWVAEQVATIPPERRLLVSNHKSFGYYADRYGFQVVGAILPSVSTGASPSAQETVELVETMRSLGVPAIFLELGAPPEMARQLAEQTGAQVVEGLYTHSVSAADGPAPTYLEIIRHNTRLIVEALR